MRRLSYGSTAHAGNGEKATPARITDRRYSTARWKRLAAAVRRRDGLCRIVPGCPRPAQVADHIFPVYEGMPDSEFYDVRNLRGGCTYHNRLRGQADRAIRDGMDTPHHGERASASILGRGTPPSSFSRGGHYERPLANLYTQKRSTDGR